MDPDCVLLKMRVGMENGALLLQTAQGSCRIAVVLSGWAGGPSVSAPGWERRCCWVGCLAIAALLLGLVILVLRVIAAARADERAFTTRLCRRSRGAAGNA